MFLYKNINIGSYPDGTFKPNEAVTRGEVPVMLLKALNIPLLDLWYQAPKLRKRQAFRTSHFSNVILSLGMQ
ncbi:hypothetical protein CSV63_09210 [Sporosarcina sp. P34]|uniref:S-layer homology domain-containing protein n=1 Tax=Sporosarcina sp. P34 TaxID=2048247 RepID=UPI000C16B713|nr:hypothetical protein CSV63_09210 [Sporosarcina sp. P34]